MEKNNWVGLLVIFGLALAIRAWYFPENVYFGYDQARDAYQSIKIYREGDLKIIGPSTAMEGLYHGPLYWYIIGPLYLLGKGNPVVPAAGLLILNAMGVFVIYWLGRMLVGKTGALFAAIMFAVSFEQSQYAMYFGNPAPGVLAVMVFFGGLAMVITEKDWRGWLVSMMGLGLAMQFEFFLVYLGVILALAMVVERRAVKINLHRIVITIIAGLVPVMSFAVAELKYGLRTITILGKMIIGGGGGSKIGQSAEIYWRRLLVLVKDNVFSFGSSRMTLVIWGVMMVGVGYLVIKQKTKRGRMALLMVWMYASAILILFGFGDLYYVNIGVGVGLLLVVAALVGAIHRYNKWVAAAIMGVVIMSNLRMIRGQNAMGIINDIYVQEGMLLTRELEAIDFIYQEAGEKTMVVSGMTMPLKINTTWSYLFSWYGKGRYGKVPYWAGEVASGYDNELSRWESQAEGSSYFSIIEPTRGVREAFVESFLEEQRQYGGVVEERSWGEKSYSKIVVQKRGKI